jgi:hypothetical protein
VNFDFVEQFLALTGLMQVFLGHDFASESLAICEGGEFVDLGKAAFA